MLNSAISVITKLFNFFVSSEVTGLVTWIGTLLTIAGLGFTFRQAREARDAARDAAKGASQAEEAVRRIENQSTLADAAHIGGQIELIIHLVGSQQYQTTQLLFGMVKRHVATMLSRSPPGNDQSETIRRNMKAAQAQITNSVSNPTKFKLTVLTKALTGLSETFVDWEQGLRSRGPIGK